MNDALLSEQSQEIKKTAGNEAFLKLIDAFGGSAIYIPKQKTVEWADAKHQAIQLLKSGTSIKEVAGLYKVSKSTVYRLAQELKEQSDNISVNESFLSEESQEIKEVVGEKAFLKLVDTFGGSRINIPLKRLEQKEKAVRMLKSGFSPKEVLRFCNNMSKSTIYRLAQSLKE